MPGFLYYIPNADKPTPALIERHGIQYAFEGGKYAWSQTIRGPGDGRGLIVADSRSVPAERVAYRTAEQTWRPIPGGDAWLGFFTAEPPGPEDLRRVKMLDGYPLKLADGREWIVPLAREAAESDGQVARRQALPRRLELDDAGEFCPGDVLPAYTELNDIAAAFVDASQQADASGRFSFGDPAAAVRVLAHNYRLDRVEAVALGLFTHGGTEAQQVLLLCTDFPGLWQLQKKTASGTSDTSDGPEDSIATTDPPLPT